MPFLLATAHLSDAEFLAAFRSRRLRASEFRHADHLRLAWLNLHSGTVETALRRVRAGIQAFARQNGVVHLYHETITTAWVLLLATHGENNFDEFLKVNEPHLNLDLLHRFWTPELLASAEARAKWVPPDRQALP